LKTIEEFKRMTDVPVVIADHQGVITYVNEPFQAVFGWTSPEILGKALTCIIPKNLHDAHHLGFSRFLTSGKATLLAQPLQLKAVTKEGKEFDAEHFIIAEEHQGQWTFGAIIRPS
jgi:PAS domain S-box-containing protein